MKQTTNCDSRIIFSLLYCVVGLCRYDPNPVPPSGKSSHRTGYGESVYLTEGATNGAAKLELAAFLDAAAYRTFSNYLGSDDAVFNFMLNFIDQVAMSISLTR